MTESHTNPARQWKNIGILADLVAPLRDRVVDGCTIEGTHVRWEYPVGHDAVFAAMDHPVIKSCRFDDPSVNWAAMLLSEHLTDDEVFLHALSGSDTTFMLPPTLRVDTNFHVWKRDTDETITIRVDWTSPRRIRLARPVSMSIFGSQGAGKAIAMQTAIYAAQARGQQVLIFDPKAGTP